MEFDYELDSGMVLVVSDSHGRHEYLEKVMNRVQPDLMLHLGDSEDCEDAIMKMGDYPMIFVRGNCDYGRGLPDSAIVRLGIHRAYLSHGHRAGGRFDLERIADLARVNGCDAAMFGHTHEPENTEQNGIIVLNPGSISLPRQDGRKPSFIAIDVDKRGEWHVALKFLKR